MVTALFLAAIMADSVALGRGRQSGSTQKSKEACENQLFNDMGVCDGKPNGTFYDSKTACQARARAAKSSGPSALRRLVLLMVRRAMPGSG